MSLVAKIRMLWLPKLANIVGSQNWQILKTKKLPKLANFEDTKVAKIGKYHQLPKLANIIGCQIWQLLKTPKLPKLAFEHTCSFLMYTHDIEMDWHGWREDIHTKKTEKRLIT